jgi:peptidoglycan biosynthesis protein MviN/MurJ (putative lipid II flippase)
MFHKKIRRIEHAALLGYTLRVGLAAAVMGAAVWGVLRGVLAWVGSAGFSARLLGAMVPVIAGALVYAVMCHILRVPELSQFTDRLARRLRR